MSYPRRRPTSRCPLHLHVSRRTREAPRRSQPHRPLAALPPVPALAPTITRKLQAQKTKQQRPPAEGEREGSRVPASICIPQNERISFHRKRRHERLLPPARCTSTVGTCSSQEPPSQPNLSVALVAPKLRLMFLIRFQKSAPPSKHTLQTPATNVTHHDPPRSPRMLHRVAMPTAASSVRNRSRASSTALFVVVANSLILLAHGSDWDSDCWMCNAPCWQVYAPGTLGDGCWSMDFQACVYSGTIGDSQCCKDGIYKPKDHRFCREDPESEHYSSKKQRWRPSYSNGGL